MATSSADYEKKLEFERMIAWRTVEPRETRPRDRSLNGKARIKARKRQNKIQKSVA